MKKTDFFVVISVLALVISMTGCHGGGGGTAPQPTPTCAEQGGNICSSGEKCGGEWIEAQEAMCCRGSCIAGGTATKTCAEQGSEVCSIEEGCYGGDWVEAAEERCCKDGACCERIIARDISLVSGNNNIEADAEKLEDGTIRVWYGEKTGEFERISFVDASLVSDNSYFATIEGADYQFEVSSPAACEIEAAGKLGTTCVDGTLYGECSTTKPRYCQDGTLVSDCQSCDCPAGQECQSDGSCSKDSVAIFIDEDTYDQLADEIERFREDIIKDLDADVFIHKGRWNSADPIRNMIISHYQDDRLLGSILIGDIPTSYFEYRDQPNEITDWYYQDLSDSFVDSDGDGRFEREYYMSLDDVTMREAWSGRIKPPVGGPEGIRLLKDYLDRNHAYRTGGLSYDRKMLYFNSVLINDRRLSEEEYNELVNGIDEYTGLYGSDVDSIYSESLSTQKAEYLSKMKDPYEFLFVNIHGAPTSQWLGGSTDISSSEIKDTGPQSFFTVLASCSNGDFTESDYIAGWWLFSGNSLVVTANSVVTMIVGGGELYSLDSYSQLRSGVTFGSMYLYDKSFLVTHLFGDPTLKLRDKPQGPSPKLSISLTELDFGTVQLGQTKGMDITFANDGDDNLVIDFQFPGITINGKPLLGGGWDKFYYRMEGVKFRDFEIRPGESKDITFTFDPRANGVEGNYTMTILFYTNDPDRPYLEVHLKGTAVEESG